MDLDSFQRFILLSQKTVSIVSLKILQKTEKCHFWRFRTFVFYLKVASKPFSKTIAMTNFGFKWSWRFCLTFREIASTLSLKNLQKTEKCYFQRFRTITIAKELAINNFWFKWCRGLCLDFPRNGLNFATQKFAKETNTIFMESEHLFLKKCHIWILKTFIFLPSGSFKTILYIL